MIVAVSVDVRLVAQDGVEIQWPLECPCPHCGGKTWGHGWVSRIFEEVADFVKVPRRRCPACRSVTTMRPSTYKTRFRTSQAQIVDALRHRLSRHGWADPRRRQRCGHWLRRFELWRRFAAPSADPLSCLCEPDWVGFLG